MLNNWLPLIILLVAFFTAMLMLLIREKSEALRTFVNLGSAAVNIVLIFVMLAGVAQGDVFETRLPLLPDINLVFKADALSLMFVGLSGVLWFFTTIYAIGYLKQGKHRSRFFGFFSLCVFSTLGIALAGNLITFLIFYELLTLATYPLIVHKGNDASLQSGKLYLRYTMIGGAVLMVGVVWLKSIAGALDFSTPGILAGMADLNPWVLTVIAAFLLIGLGVKSALFPLHGWLPRAMAAPAPVSSLLHAVAVVKAGAFGIIRVIYDVYGLELADSLGILQVLVILACFTIIYGSLRAMFQNDIKKRLAYSTVSQVSYITLGIALGSPIAAIGAIAHLVHQGIMKITMFFCAGNLAESLHIYKVSDLNGTAKKMPITMTAFTLAILGMIGIPPLAGFVSKWYLGVGAIESGYPWVIIILAGSSLLNAIYFLPLVYRAWFLPYHEDSADLTIHGNPRKPVNEAHWMMVLPPVVTIGAALLAGLFAQSDISALSWAALIVAENNPPSIMQEFSALSIENTIDGNHLLAFTLLLPFLMAIIIWRFPNINSLKFLLPLCAMPAIYLGIQSTPISQTYEILFFGSQLLLDHISQAYLLLAGILWCLGSLYSCFYAGLGGDRPQFYALFAVAMGSSFGLVLSNDTFGFLTFFTVMSLTSYVLIIRGGQPDARRAANTYIKWVMIGEVAIFSGFCILHYYSIHVELINTALIHVMAVMLIAGFGIKIGLLGFHGWLPLAHPVAAVPASALLSGFMVKAGMIGWLKFFPIELVGVSFYNIGLGTIILGIMGTFYAAMAGLMEKDPKAVLAWSTVSQMGILSSCFGVMLIAPQLEALMIPVIVFYSIHHGLAKSALFLSVGASNLLKHNHNRMLSGCFYLVLLIPALALIGAPLLSGYFAKTELKALLTELPYLKTAITVSSVFTGLLMCRFLHQLKRKAEYSESATDIGANKKYVPLVAICAVNNLLLLLTPIYIGNIVPQKVSFSQDLNVMSFATAILPIVLSIMIYALLQRYLSRDASARLFSRWQSFSRPLQTYTKGIIPASSFGVDMGESPPLMIPSKHNWLNAKEHVTKNMNSPSTVLLMMLICLLLVMALYLS